MTLRLLVLASGFQYAGRKSYNLGDVAQQARSVARLRTALPAADLLAIANSRNDRSIDPSLPLSHSLAGYLTAPAQTAIGRVLPRRVLIAIRVASLLRLAKRLAAGRPLHPVESAAKTALLELSSADALFVSGAGVFNDRYATSVGAVWAVAMRCCHILGKPIVLSGQQIGPLRSATARALSRWALLTADVVGTRDPISLDVARGLGLASERLVLTGDDAWDLPAVASSSPGGGSMPDLPSRFIAAQIRLDHATGFSPADADQAAQLLDRVAADVQLPVVFVRMYYAQTDDDLDSARLVASRMRAATHSVEDEFDTSSTKSIIGRAALAIGVSYHFCVFALSAGTPTLGLHRSPYMVQKMLGLEAMWPGFFAAIGVDESGAEENVAAAARSLTETARGASSAQLAPSLSVRPDAAVRHLALVLG